MNVTDERPWPRPSRALRIVPSAVLVLAVAAAAIGGTIRGRDEQVTDLVPPTMAEVRDYPNNPDLPITWDEAKKAGTLDRYDWGDNCDTERRYDDTGTTLARIAIPSTYSPPCVPRWNGTKPWVSRGGRTFTTNGGATAPGVTATTIKVVFYLPAELDIAKQLQQFGVQDSNAEMLRGLQEIVAMNNHLYETYGRKVELVPFQGTGDGRSPSAAKADAVKVAEMGAFASIGGPSQTTAYQHELARHQVLCIGCGLASTDDVLLRDAPYTWGYLATPDQILRGVLGFSAGEMTDGKAIFAGSAEIRSQKRRFGVVHYEQDPPIYGNLSKRSEAEFAAKGTKAAATLQYILDPNSLNAQAQAIIGRLKREHVTSVLFLGDPLMPRFLTQQATRQNYFPEWIFTGTAYTDMTSIGRLYDQRQMAHAYGFSSAAARTSPETSEAMTTFRWWYGRESTAPRTMVQWYPIVQMLYLGIDGAGPNLNATTFAGGMFRYPPTGGTNLKGKDSVGIFLDGYLTGDSTPRISFGFHQGNTVPDFVAIDDFSPIWWNVDATGPDEAGTVGKGMWYYAGNGLRVRMSDPYLPPGSGLDFLFREWLDQANPELGKTAMDVLHQRIRIATGILDAVPRWDTLPDYPVRADAPAAAGASKPGG